MVSAAVAPGANYQALRIVESHKSRERALGRSGVEPARPAIDRNLRPFEIFAEAECAEVVYRGVPAVRPVVTKCDRLARFVNAGILLMVALGGFGQFGVFFVLYRQVFDRRF